MSVFTQPALQGKERKGKDHTAVPAYEGSLAEALKRGACNQHRPKLKSALRFIGSVEVAQTAPKGLLLEKRRRKRNYVGSENTPYINKGKGDRLAQRAASQARAFARALAVKTLPTSNKEKRIPGAEAPRIPFTKRNKRKKSMGIRRVTSSNPFLILAMRVERSLLKSASASDAKKFKSILDGMGMKLQSKPGGCMRVKTKLFKRLRGVRGVDDPIHT
eukprot:1160910-Pelagomonas_calceolata.AAC.1